MYLGDSDLADRPGKIMTDVNWERWCSIRDKYDPQHMFAGVCCFSVCAQLADNSVPSRRHRSQ